MAGQQRTGGNGEARQAGSAARGGARPGRRRQTGAAALCQRCRTGDHPPPGQERLRLPPAGRRAGARHRDAAPHPLAGDPAGLDRCVDLPRPERPSAGDRSRPARPQAIPLSPALARGARRGEIRQAAGLRQGAAADPRPGRSGPEAPRAAARAGAGGHRAADGADLLPRRQHRIRQGQQELRPDHVARPPRRDRGRHASTSASAARAASSTRPTSTTAGSRASSRIAATCPATSCSSISTTTASAAPSTRPTSTNTCARSPARTSPPRISAPGPPPTSPPRPCASSSSSTARPSARRRSSTPSRRSPRISATRRRSAAAAISIPPCSTATWTARCCEGLANETQRYLEENIHGMKPEEAAVTAFLRLRLGELAARAAPPIRPVRRCDRPVRRPTLFNRRVKTAAFANRLPAEYKPAVRTGSLVACRSDGRQAASPARRIGLVSRSKR